MMMMGGGKSGLKTQSIIVFNIPVTIHFYYQRVDLFQKLVSRWLEAYTKVVVKSLQFLKKKHVFHTSGFVSRCLAFKGKSTSLYLYYV